MPTETRRLVVTPHAPGRGLLLRAALVLGGLLALWGAFEAGRYLSGYSIVSATAERFAKNGEIAALQKRLQEADAKLATLEAARRVDHEAQAQVEKSFGELQGRLGEANQELAFYRSVLNPSDGLLGMRVQRLRVQPAIKPRHFRVRLVLVQAAHQDAVTQASADFSIDGTRAGHAATLPLAEIGVSARVLNFSFRYFQELETEIELPADFQPRNIEVEVRPAKGASPIRQAYPWKIDTT